MTISISIQPGESPDRAWLRHELAAIGEGLCPHCAGRLTPCPTPKGPGGHCPQHGYWWSNPDDETGWEAVAWWHHSEGERASWPWPR